MPAPSFSAVATLRLLLRWSGRGALVLYFAAAILILVGRHWVMPEIGAWRGEIEQRLSQAIGLRVTIAGLTAGWPGLRPRLSIDRLELHDPAGRPALALERVEAEIGWSSLLFLEPRLHRLEIAAPLLEIHRDAAGAIRIAGVPMRAEGDVRIADWLLKQGRVVVRDARVIWRDDLRGAPPLELEQIDLVLNNFGRQHSLGLTAKPGGGVAAHIDLRANLTGRSLADLSAWAGQAYIDLARVDLAALSHWLDLPFEMKRGQGDARLWLDFAGRAPTGFAADVALADFSLRLRPDLPLLVLQRADGRLAGRQTADGYSGEMKHLSLTTASGIALAPKQASLNLVTAQRGQGGEQGGELRASHLDLGALARLADYLPLPADWRAGLHRFAPRGRLDDFGFAWQGAAGAPEHWRIESGFAGLALAAQGQLPGFTGISGRIEGDRRGGQIHLDSRAATIDLPAVLPEPTLALERLEAEIGWRGRPDATEVLFQRVVFANADLQGDATGSYRHDGAGLGEIDLSARLDHAVGAAVWRYMPRVANKDARDWLRAGILGGRVDSATLRLKGPLARFPFREGQGGIFQVRGRIRGASLNFAPGWPNMTGIDGELLFEGVRMSIRGQRGEIMGVALADILAEIPDLEAKEGEMLTVTGRAKGETQRFLDFIEASPVGGRIDHFTAGMSAAGGGELDLKLVMPLRRVVDTEVQGRYRFADNRLAALPGLPPFTAAQGELNFTAERLQARNLRARFLDQPLTLEVGTLPGGAVRIAAAGNLEAHALRRFYGLRALDHLSGTTPWRGSLTVKKPTAELRIESDLRGLASSLPEPFNKSARAGLPLTVAGRFEPQRDEWIATLDTAAALRL
ncbi:MAG: TIGR02099 family protein, partial [Sulfuritalea sp.]|nr:TIGR02099 family protein [Sulfuritalea sp.]